MQFKNQCYIDKTERLEKGIAIFPSIYIEGAAASGKTTAVNMLLEKHPEVKQVVLQMGDFHDASMLRRKLQAISVQMKTEITWVVFENMSGQMAKEISSEMVQFVEILPKKCRAIFIGRERPEEGLLSLLWKRKMEWIPQEALLFTKAEIQKLVEIQKSSLNPDEIYVETGGWAGCVDLMIRISRGRNARELRSCYEINSYIRTEILETLSKEEQEMMRRAAICPWLNMELCQAVWGIPQAGEVLEILQRKGMFLYNHEKNQWKIAPLFRLNFENKWKQPSGFWEHLGEWYEANGFLEEALRCLKQSKDQRKYRNCMIAHYYEIPFLGYPYEEVMSWKEHASEITYLRGMHCYVQQDFGGLKREIHKLHPENGAREREIYLNLSYLNPELTLEDWLNLLEIHTEDKDNIRIYTILGNAHTYLCGLRDLSDLFACTKKEEKRKAKMWKERLDKESWFAYRMARIDYYLETERKVQISQEDCELLNWKGGEISWRTRLAKLYLNYKLVRMESSDIQWDSIRQLESSLLREENEVCAASAEALISLYSSGGKTSEELTRWLRYTDTGMTPEVTEENYIVLCCQAKGYLRLNQYEKAEKIFRRVIPYVQTYKRYRFLTELLFQQAIVNWKRKSHSMALKCVIESFVVNGNRRYVDFYTGYGNSGMATMEMYVDWLRTHAPEGWHKKKKYNYGNVLRMPQADYMEVILRCMKREERQNPAIAEELIEERLTMMETIVLQCISRGLTNAEICEELDLKLTTVKSHIYSLYKKLGVNSRMQAVLRGKELGMIE